MAHPGGQLPLLLDAVRLLHLHPLHDPAPDVLRLAQGADRRVKVVVALVDLGQQRRELGLRHERVEVVSLEIISIELKVILANRYVGLVQ